MTAAVRTAALKLKVTHCPSPVSTHPDTRAHCACFKCVLYRDVLSGACVHSSNNIVCSCKLTDYVSGSLCAYLTCVLFIA